MNPRRGAILLETVIALALFIGAAAFTTMALSRTVDGLERAEREARALDLARSVIAQLQAGLLDLAEVRDGENAFDVIGSVEFGEHQDIAEHWISGWTLEVDTVRSEFTGLSLVTVTVFDPEVDDGGLAAAGPMDGERRPSATLRQLIRVSDADEDGYESDDLLEGLPDASETSGGVTR